MTTFNEREKGFENKFAHDEDLRFKALARRNRMLGSWAAGKLGLTGPDADTYAKQVVLTEFDAGGDEAVFQKLHNDFAAKDLPQADAQIRKAMSDLLVEAAAQIQAGK